MSSCISSATRSSSFCATHGQRDGAWRMGHGRWGGANKAHKTQRTCAHVRGLRATRGVAQHLYAHEDAEGQQETPGLAAACCLRTAVHAVEDGLLSCLAPARTGPQQGTASGQQGTASGSGRRTTAGIVAYLWVFKAPDKTVEEGCKDAVNPREEVGAHCHRGSTAGSAPRHYRAASAQLL